MNKRSPRSSLASKFNQNHFTEVNKISIEEFKYDLSSQYNLVKSVWEKFAQAENQIV